MAKPVIPNLKNKISQGSKGKAEKPRRIKSTFFFDYGESIS
jgi:hypothetical protein